MMDVLHLDLNQTTEFNVSHLIRSKRKKAQKKGDKSRKKQKRKEKPGDGFVVPDDEVEAAHPSLNILSSGSNVKGLDSVISRIERQYGKADDGEDDLMEDEDSMDEDTGQGDENEDEDEENAMDEDDEDNDQDGNEENEEEVDTDQRNSSNQQPNRRKRKRRTKEEVELREAGEGFYIYTDDEEEKTMELERKLEKELEYEGFYVHRGPLLSKERRKRLQEREDRKKSANRASKSKKSSAGPSSKKRQKKNVISIADGGKRREDSDISNQLKRLERQIDAVAEKNKGTDKEKKFSTKYDAALLSLANLYENANHDSRRKIIQRIRALLPHQTEKMLVKHLERVRHASSVKEERRLYLEEQDKLKKSVERRLEEVTKEDHVKFPASLWLETLAKDINSKSLESLYYQKGEAKPTKVSDTLADWKKLTKLLNDKLKQIKGGKVPQDRKLCLHLELCLGYARRRSLGEQPGTKFTWDKKGVQQLQKFGRTHKQAYERAMKTWAFEKELLGKQKTVCKDRGSAFKDLVGFWPSSVMQKQELLAITVDSFIESAKPMRNNNNNNNNSHTSANKGGETAKEPVVNPAAVSSNRANDAATSAAATTTQQPVVKKEGGYDNTTAPYGSVYLQLGKPFNPNDFDVVAPKDGNPKSQNEAETQELIK